MVCKTDTRVWARTALRPVDSATARVDLYWSARSRGYRLLREEIDPRFLWRGECADLVMCAFRSESSRRSELTLDVAPASPFIVFKGRTRVTFMVKKVK
jgi:hypothetical protein